VISNAYGCSFEWLIYYWSLGIQVVVPDVEYSDLLCNGNLCSNCDPLSAGQVKALLNACIITDFDTRCEWAAIPSFDCFRSSAITDLNARTEINRRSTQ
jgi:hypothetical protein